MRRFFMVCRLGSFLLGLFILLSLLTGGAKAAQMAAADTLLEGRQADRFDAVSELTNAQILVISARLYDRLTGGSGLAAPAVGEAWYQSALTLLSGLSTDTAQSAMSRSVLQAWRYSEGTD